MRSIKGLGLTLVVLMAVLALTACGGGGDGKTPTPTATGTPTQEPSEETVITIGCLSDLTGPGSAAFGLLNMSFEDLAEYFNENILPPNVKLKILMYDSQNDPAKDIPGYEWLRERGADLIFSAEVSAGPTLKARVDRDNMVLFVASAGEEALVPPGYIFTASGLPEAEAFTYLKWIAENDWDYRTSGPAKIGAASWEDAYSVAFLRAMKDYAGAHPDQFTWVDGFLTSFGTFAWGSAVEGLKDCDYVFPPVVMTSFVREYRNAGYSAKFMIGGVQSAFFAAIDDAKLWDELDGSPVMQASKWWTDTGELIDLTKELLYKNHPGEAEEIMRAGSGYVAMQSWYPYFDMIAKTVERVGAENFDSQALYDTALSYSLTVDGVEHVSFNQTKRDGPNYFRMYRISSTEKAAIVADPEWVPVIREP